MIWYWSRFFLLFFTMFFLGIVSNVWAQSCPSSATKMYRPCTSNSTYPSCVGGDPVASTASCEAIGSDCWAVFVTNDCRPVADFPGPGGRCVDNLGSQAICGGPGGGTCGGTRGSCSGSCPSGQTCRAPSNTNNGDACACHSSGGGQVCTAWENTCRKSVAAGGSGCSGNNIAGPVAGGCSPDCKSTQVCCSQRTCVSPIDPVGIHNPSNCTNSRGWTCDGSDFNTPLTVGFYADGLGPSNFIGSVRANRAATSPTDAQAIAAQCGGHSNRRFIFTTPESLKDGNNHQIYAVAINTGAGDNKLLTGSPKTINCPAPVMSCTGVTPSDNPSIASSSTTYTVYAHGVVNASSVDFAVGSDISGGVQHTYTGVNQGGGTWRATINFATYHNDHLGHYNVDVLMEGTDTCGSADFVRNVTPTMTSLITKNNSGTTVGWDSNRNHVCKAGFNGSRTVTFEAVLTDGDGGSDIVEANLQWNGSIYPMTLSNVSGNNVTASATVTYPSDIESNIELPITIEYSDRADAGSLGFVATGYSWKVWDCNVPVSYSIFDGSAGQACNNTGFSTVAGPAMGFTSLNYKNMSGGSDSTTNLEWKDSYLPLVNGGTVSDIDGDLAAAGRFTRLIDLGVGTTICPSGSQFSVATNVSPYAVDPRLKTDLSYIQDQEGWFQGRGVDIRSKSEVSAGVPVTANSTLITDNSAIGTSNGGVVASGSYRNTNGWNTETQYGSPNNWWVNTALTDSQKNNYQTFYNNYFVKLGVGVTGVTSVGTGSTGVIFVNGDLNINNDVTVPVNSYLMAIVSGSVNIGVGASRVDGIYIANNGIGATGTSDNQLVINGILYATNDSDIRLSRSFETKSLNNSTPAVVVNYRPNLIFSMPGRLNKILSGWREN